MDRLTLKRRLFRAFFWFLLTYTAMSSTFVWVIQLGLSPGNIRPPLSVPKADIAYDIAECNFAERFTREYFLWTQGKKESRVQRLADFMVSDLDKQAGMELDNAKWDSYAIYVRVWNVRNHAKYPQVKEVTVYAETIMSKVGQPEDKKRVNRYLVVPIQTAGRSYRVVDIPYFIPGPVATRVNVPVTGVKRGEPVSDAEYLEIQNFAKSFFKVYTNGETQEIGYFFRNYQSKAGLTGVLDFVHLNDLSAYKESGRVKAMCDVAFKDLHSGAHVNYPMQLMLEKSGSQWFVTDITQGRD